MERRLQDSSTRDAMEKSNPQEIEFYQGFFPIQRDSGIQLAVLLCDEIVNNSSELAAAIERFNRSVKKLEDQGILMVVANGNEQNSAPTNVELRPDAAFSFLAMNDHVIPVGYSDTNHTPAKLSDDRPGPHSSHGYYDETLGKTWGPFLMAPGNFIAIDDYGFSGGSSEATAFVSGVIALMLETNPSLTNDQIREILTKSCEKWQGEEPEVVGHGFLNPVTAVKLAQR